MEQLFDFLKTNIHFMIVLTYVIILYYYIDQKDTYVMLGFTVITGFLLLQSKHIIEGQAASDGGTQTNPPATSTTDPPTATSTTDPPTATSTTDPPATGKQAGEQVGEQAGKQTTTTTSSQIDAILKSEEYLSSKEEKKALLGKLKGLKAANEKESPALPPQEYLQNDTLIKIQRGVPRIGAYDGLCLSGLTTKKNYHLVSNDKVSSYMGVQYPPEEMATEDDSLDGPSIDGDDDSPHKLSMFANNMTSINCCGDSPYVSSSGCICMTKKQKNFIQNRGLYTTNTIAEVEEGSDIQVKNTLPKPTKNEIILMDSDGANNNVRLAEITETSVGGGQTVGETPQNYTGGERINDPGEPIVPLDA